MFGLAEAEFWGLTPRQLLALLDQQREREERRDLRAALLCSVIANCAPFVKRRRSFEPKDFMPRAGRGAHRAGGAVPHKDIINKARHAFTMAGIPVVEKAHG